MKLDRPLASRSERGLWARHSNIKQHKKINRSNSHNFLLFFCLLNLNYSDFPHNFNEILNYYAQQTLNRICTIISLLLKFLLLLGCLINSAWVSRNENNRDRETIAPERHNSLEGLLFSTTHYMKINYKHTIKIPWLIENAMLAHNF